MPETGLVGARNLFIRRWGEMAASWGISRTMAEIHALMYLSPVPLCTDDVMEHLEVSRGSASINLRELVNWGLITRVHHRGDRKEYFETEKDVWQMFQTITRERRRRELQPILETIQRCLAMLSEEPAATRGPELVAYEQRLAAILEFVDVLNTLFDLLMSAGKTGIKPLRKQLTKLSG